MPKNLINFLQTQQENFILWLIFIFCLGSSLAITFFANFTLEKTIFLAFLALFSLFLYKKHQNSYFCLIFIIFFGFFSGFLSSYLNQKTRLHQNQITGKIFAEITGQVADVNKNNILIQNPTFKRAKFAKKPKKPRKITKNYRQNYFANIKNRQEIDLEFIIQSKNYQNIDKNLKKIKKIRIFARKNRKTLKIGDVITLKAMIEPIKKPNYPGDFDFQRYNRAKNIAGQGYALSEIEIIAHKPHSSTQIFWKNLRKKIQNKIDHPIIKALLTGDRKSIDSAQMQDIRDSGLAHLIAISGLHLGLAAAIFFLTSRHLLLQSQYLTTHYNIKKIAAFLAIFSSYCYLKIAGEPISAQRAFIMVIFVMIAIIFDRKTDLLRSICFAALFIILINPYNIYLPGFQLSFAALFTIAATHQICAKINNKFIRYPLELIIISIAIQITTAPLLIYHFGNVTIYGFIANLVAIPLVSFITMPLGFLGLFLMPFGLEKTAFAPMSTSIGIITNTANFVANLKGSHLNIPKINTIPLIISTISAISFILIKSRNCKIILAISFLIPLFTIKEQPKPDLIIDGNSKIFAIFDQKSLIFTKKVRKSKKIQNWMQKMQVKSYKIQKNLCQKEYCQIKNTLILLKRTKISTICQKNQQIIINLTKKYQIPPCAKAKIIIDNHDFLEKGTHLIYFKKNHITVKTITDQINYEY